MLYTKLCQNVIDDIKAGVHAKGVEELIGSPEHRDAAVKWVQECDVRRVDRMRSLFPASFPKSMQKGMLYVGYNAQGHWCVSSRPLPY